MRTVIGIHSLAGQGGTESWVTTIGDHLQRVGHDVWIYSQEDGVTGEIARELGLRTVSETRELPDDIEVMLPQDTVSALELAAGHAGVPQVFVSHSGSFDVQLVPQLPDVTCGVITLYDHAQDRIESAALVPPIRRLRQPVDVQRFRPLRPIGKEPRVALSLGNYLLGDRLAILRAACERAGIEFRQVGATAGGTTTTPELAMNEADIVFGKAKVIHEAMACGRAAFVYDQSGCEGFVTADNYELLVADCFAGRTAPRPITVEELAADLRGYDASMGLANRDLIVANHAAESHTAELVKAVREFTADRPPGPRETRPELIELARMARVNWRHEGDAYSMRMRLHATEVHARDQIESLNARLREADALLTRIQESARWRLVQRLLGPFDRLRGRS